MRNILFNAIAEAEKHGHSWSSRTLSTGEAGTHGGLDHTLFYRLTNQFTIHLL